MTVCLNLTLPLSPWSVACAAPPPGRIKKLRWPTCGPIVYCPAMAKGKTSGSKAGGNELTRTALSPYLLRTSLLSVSTAGRGAASSEAALALCSSPFADWEVGA